MTVQILVDSTDPFHISKHVFWELNVALYFEWK